MWDLSISFETIGVPSPFNRETSYFDTSREMFGSMTLVVLSIEMLRDPTGIALFSSQETKHNSRNVVMIILMAINSFLFIFPPNRNDKIII